MEAIPNPDLIVHIGTSGWSYDHWEGVLHPHQLTPRSGFDRAISSAIKPWKLIAPTTAGHQTLPLRSGRERLAIIKRFVAVFEVQFHIRSVFLQSQQVDGNL
ncbi:hypothetical protein QUA20_21005 [Microcoleus sp. Pol7_A1]|uniref:hypothetical protein n=1 Tax=Microcoleus sp. Pol7_A1 TaxID=2818893 RepID=UPI002FD11A80